MTGAEGLGNAELAAALDLAPVIVRCFDGRIRFWGTGACWLYGYTTEEAVGCVSHELLRTAFPVPLDEINAELLRNGRWQGDLRHRRKDGAEVAVASLWTLRGDISHPDFLVEVNNDVTAMHAQERERLRLAAVVDSSEDAIIANDLEGKVTSWNLGAERMLGFTAAEMIGRKISVLAPPGLEDDMPRMLARIRRGEPVEHYETRRRRKDGSIIDVSLTVSPVRDHSGAIIGASKIARDITARRQAEQALLESEQRFRAVLENAPWMMWVNRPDGSAEFFNGAGRTYLGLCASLPGLAWTDALHPEDREPFLAVRARAVAAGEEYGTEYRLRRQDGVYHWHASRVVPLKRDGVVYSWVGAAADIDTAKRVTAVLEERVAERTRRLAEANAELEAFAYSVAHDLRAPLRSIRGFSQALIEDYGSSFDANGHDFANRIMKGADRLDGLINDLLAYSRLTREEIRLEPIDLKALFGEVLEQMRGVIQERQAEVIAELDEVSVLGHRSILNQVLLNLLGNAIKFTRPDRPPVVRVGIERRAGMVRVLIEDNGIGIDARHAERIFRVFERLHGADSPYPGTGIGLAIVKKGIERLGGHVGVEAGAGDGSRFWLELALP